MQDISKVTSDLMESDQERSIAQWTEAHDVAFQRFIDQNREDVWIMYFIPLR